MGSLIFSHAPTLADPRRPACGILCSYACEPQSSVISMATSKRCKWRSPASTSAGWIALSVWGMSSVMDRTRWSVWIWWPNAASGACLGTTIWPRCTNPPISMKWRNARPTGPESNWKRLQMLTNAVPAGSCWGGFVFACNAPKANQRIFVPGGCSIWDQKV